MYVKIKKKSTRSCAVSLLLIPATSLNNQLIKLILYLEHLLTCKNEISNLNSVMNMNAKSILPASCKQVLGLFSPSDGTPAKRLRPSARASATTSSRAPMRAKLRSKNCMSHNILQANVWKRNGIDGNTGENQFIIHIKHGTRFLSVPVVRYIRVRKSSS